MPFGNSLGKICLVLLTLILNYAGDAQASLFQPNPQTHDSWQTGGMSHSTRPCWCLGTDRLHAGLASTAPRLCPVDPQTTGLSPASPVDGVVGRSHLPFHEWRRDVGSTFFPVVQRAVCRQFVERSSSPFALGGLHRPDAASSATSGDATAAGIVLAAVAADRHRRNTVQPHQYSADQDPDDQGQKPSGTGGLCQAVERGAAGDRLAQPAGRRHRTTWPVGVGVGPWIVDSTAQAVVAAGRSALWVRGLCRRGDGGLPAGRQSFSDSCAVQPQGQNPPSLQGWQPVDPRGRPSKGQPRTHRPVAGSAGDSGAKVSALRRSACGPVCWIGRMPPPKN